MKKFLLQLVVLNYWKFYNKIYDALKDDFEVHITTDIIRGSKYINNNYNFSLIDVPNIYSNLVLLPYNFIKFFFQYINLIDI